MRLSRTTLALHCQAEGRRDTATDTGDPSPVKAFPARAVRLHTSDNHPFSRRHGGSAQWTDCHGRLVNPRVCHRDLFRSRLTTQMQIASARAVAVPPHARHGAALPVGLMPKHKGVKWRTPPFVATHSCSTTKSGLAQLQPYCTHGMHNSSRHCSQYHSFKHIVSTGCHSKANCRL